MPEVKLGKLPYTPDDRDITFAQLKEKAAVDFPKPPNRFGHGLDYKAWGMLGNGPDDSVESGFAGCGDCVFAGAAHETMIWNKIAGNEVTFDGYGVVSDYSALTGYVIGDDMTDQGTDVREALGYRRHTGIVDADGNRHKIAAYVGINASDWDELMEAAFTFSQVGIGFLVPDTVWDQYDNHHPWDVVDPNAPIDGGHYVNIVGRSSINIGGFITWGERRAMTKDFYETYNDESWAIVTLEEFKNGKTERGFDLTELKQLLKELP